MMQLYLDVWSVLSDFILPLDDCFGMCIRATRYEAKSHW